MSNNKIFYALICIIFIQTNTSLISSNSSVGREIAEYIEATIQENENFLKALKKAGDDKAKIAKASQSHQKALTKIRKNNSTGLNDYYKVAFHPDKAKGEKWRKANAELKEKYKNKLGRYWEKLKIAQDDFSKRLKALRNEYSSQLKEYEEANRQLFHQYWN